MPKGQALKKFILCGSESCKECEVIHLYNFPKLLEYITKRFENLGIVVESVKHSCRICSRHFDHHLLGQIRLYNHAIPTPNLGI